ncbi:MAG: DUF4446 family protein [Patescibacteria group bacterium]|jgi:hypothetical protein
MSYTALGVVVVWNVLLTLVLVYIWFFLKSFFPQKKRGIHQAIEDSIGRSEKLDKQIQQMTEEIKNHKEQTKTSFKKLGLVRFNPFDRLGGEQSYCLALLNEKKDGFVITFLYTHEGVRVYVKEVLGGKGGEVDLSKEEEKAIVKAI